jgi:hypothetical protein
MCFNAFNHLEIVGVRIEGYIFVLYLNKNNKNVICYILIGNT